MLLDALLLHTENVLPRSIVTCATTRVDMLEQRDDGEIVHYFGQVEYNEIRAMNDVRGPQDVPSRPLPRRVRERCVA